MGVVSMYVERVMPDENGKYVWQPQVESFDLESDFSIEEETVSIEGCCIPQLLCRYGTLAAEQGANVKRKEENVKKVQAEVEIDIRGKAAATGEKKTEALVKAEVIVDIRYQNALLELHILRADAAKVDHWFRALMKKADQLRSMDYRQSAELNRMPG